jgi:hypothetical protein
MGAVWHARSPGSPGFAIIAAPKFVEFNLVVRDLETDEVNALGRLPL